MGYLTLKRTLRSEVKSIMKLQLMAEVDNLVATAKLPAYERDTAQAFQPVTWDVRTMRAVDLTRDMVRVILGDIENELIRYMSEVNV